jgi:DNA-binding response OmpR family regulator
MNLPRILLLEDEAQLAKIVAETLQNRGYTVVHFSNGRLGLEALRGTVGFDLCIVDVMMPFMDGFSFVKELRKTEKLMPVLFLTARSQDKDVVEGYESGGNDYLRKPFSLEELLLRIKELLQRSQYQSLQKTEPLLIGDYTHFPHRQELLHNTSGSSTKLSHRENELLKLLIQHRNQLLDRKSTLLKLWGEDSPYHARTMDVFITKLRKHLQEDNSIEIINVRGHGYKLLC